MGSSAPPPPDLTSKIVRQQRAIVGGALVLLVAAAWWFLVSGAGLGGHAAMDMAMPAMAPPPLTALIAMWWLMMVAMMVPSAAPAILLYAKVRASRRGDGDAGDTWIFLAGYLLVWLAFSVAAAFLQQLFAGPAMALAAARAAGALLVAAGIYQLTPLKSACLRQCRSPAQFISRHWRPGAAGALRLGLLHGAYCVGCCWLLMTLLFVGGVMNFAWIAALTALVAAEKLLPRGDWLARLSGAALIAWGAVRIAS